MTSILYAVFIETKHVLWQAHSFVLPISVSWSSLLYTVMAPRCIVSSRKEVLKRCRDVVANLCRRYVGGDGLFSVIIQRRISGCATGVLCKSNEPSVGGKAPLTAYVQQTCLTNATAAQGSCSSVDISCLCSSATYLNTLACCLAKNCSQADQKGTAAPREAALIIC